MDNLGSKKEFDKQKLILDFLQMVKNQDTFEQVISIKEIQEKLKNNISDVKYSNNPLLNGSWNAKLKEITINVNNISNSEKAKRAITHETLHVLSDGQDRSGLRRIDRKNNFERGRGLNEGMTEALVEKLTGKTNENIYEKETSVYKLLTGFIDEKYFLEDYIKGTNTIDKQFRQRYGEQMYKGYLVSKVLLDKYNSMNTALRKISNKDINELDKKQEMRKIYNDRKIVEEKIDTTLDYMIDLKLKTPDMKINSQESLNFINSINNYYPNKKVNIAQPMEDKLEENIEQETKNVNITQINIQSKNIKEIMLDNSKMSEKLKGDQR